MLSQNITTLTLEEQHQDGETQEFCKHSAVGLLCFSEEGPSLTVPRFNSAPLRIIVGRDDGAQTFYINEQQATKFSDVITAAIKGGFKESEEETITFPEDDPELFNIFANFIYTGYIRSHKPEDKAKSPGYDSEWDPLGAMRVLGEKLQAGEFKDAVVDAVVEKLRIGNKYPATMHQAVYPGSIGPCGMRRLVVDAAAWGWSKTTLECIGRKQECSDFFFDLSVQLRSLVGATLPPAPVEAFRWSGVSVPRSWQREGVLQDHV